MNRNIFTCKAVFVLSLTLSLLGYGQTVPTDSVCISNPTLLPLDSSYSSFPIQAASQFRSSIVFEVQSPNGSLVSLEVFNVQGAKVLEKDFSLLPARRYKLTFPNVSCPGVYFVHLRIDSNTVTQSISLQQTKAMVETHDVLIPTDDATIADGIWQKAYTQFHFPELSPTIIPQPRMNADTVLNQVVLELRRGTYNISWTARNNQRIIESEKYKGGFVLLGDTIKFYDSRTQAVTKFYKYRMYSDTLSLGDFRHTIDGHPIARVPIRTVPSFMLDGIYHRTKGD